MKLASFFRASMMVTFIVTSGLTGCDCSANIGTSPRCSSSAACSDSAACIDGRCVARVDSGAPQDSGRLDSGPFDAGVMEDAGPCRAISGASTVEPVPVDIIVVIDNSGSMSEEAAEVQRNINNFAAIIAASGLDYRVVLISTPTGTRGVCVPAPLGSGPAACTSGPDGRLLAIHQAVASRNAPNLSLSLYPMYSDFLRMDAAKVFLWITDDESATYDADSFRAALAALAPAGMFANTIHNAIVGYYGDTEATWSTASAGACGSLARVGATYMRLAECLREDGTLIADCTPGRHGRVCDTDWTAIFEDIAMGVVAGVPVACEFAIPPPPAGMTIDEGAIRVTYTAGDMTSTNLTRAASAAECTATSWYFDDPAAPTSIVLCPDLCRTVQLDAGARLDIGLGCFPIFM